MRPSISRAARTRQQTRLARQDIVDIYADALRDIFDGKPVDITEVHAAIELRIEIELDAARHETIDDLWPDGDLPPDECF